jgi:hypothetical protein
VLNVALFGGDVEDMEITEVVYEIMLIRLVLGD